jgi:hypothetical protein
MLRDIIIAYAYINEVTAVRFNTRTNLGGRFPVNTTKKVEPQPYMKPEILLCICLTGGDKNSPSSLAYKSGQYIKVCKRERICVRPMALIKVLLTWVGLVALMISRKLSGMKKPEDYELPLRFLRSIFR